MSLASTHSDLLSSPESQRRERAETELSFYSATLMHFYDVANAAFAAESQASASVRHGPPGHRTQASTTADPEVVASTADAPALRALEQLRGWLNVSYGQLGQVTGLSPSVIHYWRRRHRENQPVRPRASSVEQLWRVHSALRSVAEALDGDDSGYGVQMWAWSARDGDSPLDLLTRGDVDEVERRASRLLFDQSPRRPSSWRLAAPDVEIETEHPAHLPPVDYGETDFG